MARENRLWGAERIQGELLKLGIQVAKRTTQKYMPGARPPRVSGQTWGTFLKTHAQDIRACDFLPVVDLFRLIFTFFDLELGSRRVVHFGVSRHPTDEWVAHHLCEATPSSQAPRFMIRDRDRKYGPAFNLVASREGTDQEKGGKIIAFPVLNGLPRDCGGAA